MSGRIPREHGRGYGPDSRGARETESACTRPGGPMAGWRAFSDIRVIRRTRDRTAYPDSWGNELVDAHEGAVGSP